MKAFEFQTHLGPHGMMPVPDEVMAQLNPDQPVRVLLLVPESPEGGWEVVTAEQFLKGYADSDAVYDQLRESGPGAGPVSSHQ